MILIDTNVLLYAYDQNDVTRQNRALEVLEQLESAVNGCLSVQCLAEFFSVATRKLNPPLEVRQAAEQVELFTQSFPAYEITQAIVLEGVRGVRDHQFAYWDAQLWASAKLNQISTVFSEDFGERPSVEGVRFVNPFKVDFEIRDWV